MKNMIKKMLAFFTIVTFPSFAFSDTLIRIDNYSLQGRFLKKNNNFIIFKGNDEVVYYFKYWQVKSLILEKDKGDETISEIQSPPQRIIMEGRKKISNGERISIDVKDMDIKDLFLELAKIGNFNVILHDSVQGRVTMKLKDVPLYQVIDLLCKQFNIGYEIVIINKEELNSKR